MSEFEKFLSMLKNYYGVDKEFIDQLRAELEKLTPIEEKYVMLISWEMIISVAKMGPDRALIAIEVLKGMLEFLRLLSTDWDPEKGKKFLSLLHDIHRKRPYI